MQRGDGNDSYTLNGTWCETQITSVSGAHWMEGQTTRNVCPLRVDGAVFLVKGRTTPVNANHKDERCNLLYIQIYLIFYLIYHIQLPNLNHTENMNPFDSCFTENSNHTYKPYTFRDPYNLNQNNLLGFEGCYNSWLQDLVMNFKQIYPLHS